MGIKTIIIAVIALAVAGGGAYYVTTRDNNDDQQDSSTQTSGQNGESSTISELLSSGENVECTFSTSQDNGTSVTGTVYVADERMRGTYTSNAPDQQEQKSHIIHRDSEQYLWQDGADEGIKMQFDESDADTENQNIDSQGLDQNQDYNFECSEWSVDESMFEPPENVNFSELPSPIDQAQNLQENSNQSQMERCGDIPDESARQACMNAAQ